MSTDEDARSNELTKKTKGRVQEPQPFDKQDPTEPVEVNKVGLEKGQGRKAGVK